MEIEKEQKEQEQINQNEEQKEQEQIPAVKVKKVKKVKKEKEQKIKEPEPEPESESESEIEEIVKTPTIKQKNKYTVSKTVMETRKRTGAQKKDLAIKAKLFDKYLEDTLTYEDVIRNGFKVQPPKQKETVVVIQKEQEPKKLTSQDFLNWFK